MSNGEICICIQNYIKNIIPNSIRIPALCSIFHLSLESIDQIFLDNFGITLLEFINQLRGNYAKSLLANSDYSICVIADKLGMTYYQFQKFFMKLYGQSAGDYRSEMLVIAKNSPTEFGCFGTMITQSDSTSRIHLLIDYVLDYFEQMYPNVSVSDICRAINISKDELDLCFSTVFNISFSKFITQYRLKKIREELEYTDYSERTIAINNGIAPYYFETFFSRNMLCSPSDYRELMDDTGRAISIKMKKGDNNNAR